MKRAKSDLIDAFLINVRKGLITGREDSSGPVVIEQMVAALEAIKAGSDPDTALKITRSAGQPADPENLLLAFYIHKLRTAGDSWATVEFLANEWLGQQGRQRVTGTRLKRLYKQHQTTIRRHEDILRMSALTSQRNK